MHRGRRRGWQVRRREKKTPEAGFEQHAVPRVDEDQRSVERQVQHVAGAERKGRDGPAHDRDEGRDHAEPRQPREEAVARREPEERRKKYAKRFQVGKSRSMSDSAGATGAMPFLPAIATACVENDANATR